MTDDSVSNSSRKITDRDLACLLRRGIEEAAQDPTAAEIYKRIQQRENIEEDREHRERSEKSAVLGVLTGLLLLAAFIIGSVATFHP